MILDQNKSLILVIDVQEKLLKAVFNKEKLENKSEIIIKTCDILNIPVFITEQYPKGLGETVNSVKNSVRNAKFYVKEDFNALADFKLLEDLKNTNRKQVIVFGIETHICVYQTVCALLENGFDVTVLKDSCGSRLEEEFLTALDCMKINGAKIKTTEMVVFEWLKSSKHPKFKEIQGLVK